MSCEFSFYKVARLCEKSTHYGSNSDFVDSSWYPIDNYVICSKFSESHRAFLAAITTRVIPRTNAEAFDEEHWCDAIWGEINALEENGTWTVETLPADKKALGYKWVFTVKYRSDGSLKR